MSVQLDAYPAVPTFDRKDKFEGWWPERSFEIISSSWTSLSRYNARTPERCYDKEIGEIVLKTAADIQEYVDICEANKHLNPEFMEGIIAGLKKAKHAGLVVRFS